MHFIDSDQLADIIKGKGVPMKDYIVVDVRDDDYAGGNIKGCINQPSNGFLGSVDQLVKKTQDVSLVIFHCALSQMRGPKAARIYEETCQNLLVDKCPRVAVLRDGFSGFQAKFKDDLNLIENWDKDVWAAEWS